MLTQPSRRRHIPITLQDIPERVRMTGAVKACRNEPDPEVRAEIVYAALCPSNTVYWIAADAVAA